MPSRPPIHNPFPKVVRRHQAAAAQRVEHERQRERLNPHQRGYNREWRKVSRAFLQAHPLCTGFDSHCEAAGKFTPSTDVDHVVPHRGNLRLFWDQSNWQALCHSCHASKTAREDGGWGRPVASKRDRWAARAGKARTIEGQAHEVRTVDASQTRVVGYGRPRRGRS